MIKEAPLFQYSKQADDYDRIGVSVIVVAVVLSLKESLSFLNYLNSLSLNGALILFVFASLRCFFPLS
jgi:hypothetical protein